MATTAAMGLDVSRNNSSNRTEKNFQYFPEEQQIYPEVPKLTVEHRQNAERDSAFIAPTQSHSPSENNGPAYRESKYFA